MSNNSIIGDLKFFLERDNQFQLFPTYYDVVDNNLATAKQTGNACPYMDGRILAVNLGMKAIKV